MKTYTVAELAKLSGVSIRTLHHYDDIGLLKPAFTGENRYRYYGREELLRLQQILIDRELGVPLAEISTLIDATGFDRLQALRKQRERLQAQAKRFAGLVRTIDRTIAVLQGDGVMKEVDLYQGMMPEKQAEYEAWLIDADGGDMPAQVAASRKKFASLTDDERKAVMDELRTIEDGLANGLRSGVPPQAAILETLVRRHCDWVSYAWQRPVTPEAYTGLAELYQSHPDFGARFEQIEAGFTDYLVTAMKSWASRQD